ncbi:MAG TPA: SUMF1/EgtB/PvdO family nonheme iron enzyme [Streptosporangiaceae bacterium]
MPRRWLAIPAGTVTIGSPEDHLDAIAGVQHYPREWFEDETPQHRVTVGTFGISRYPVTNAEFTDFTAATGYLTTAEERGFGLVYAAGYWEERQGASWRRPAGPYDSVEDRLDHPVVQVTHADAAAYAAWAGARLPTEDEWEYAAHGAAWACWPWGDDWDLERANTAEYWAKTPIADFRDWRTWWERRQKECREVPATSPVGAFSPAGDSPFGVADMAGNVTEWTATRYQMYDPGRRYDPVYAIAAGRYVVVRGGDWMKFRYQVRTSERIACDPGYANFATGFRCASDLAGP